MNKYRNVHSIAAPANTAIARRRRISNAARRNARRGVLIAAMLACGAVAHAQTWESPLTFNSEYYTSSFSTCGAPQGPLIFDNGLYLIEAPTVVYRAVQLRLGRNPPPLRPWHVTLVSPPYVDLSLWVCRTHENTYYVNQCVDMSDGIDFGLPEQVVVPALSGFYYVIVTGGITTYPPVSCGSYTLTAYHG